MRIEMNENTAAAISDAINEMAMGHDVSTPTGKFWDRMNYWFAQELVKRGLDDPAHYTSSSVERVGK